MPSSSTVPGLDDRKAAVLRAVVEEYIETAQPVGSGHVVASSGLAVSAATIRNEMGALERDGYLQQPHTSAGRVPTEKGYRFYVDNLVPPDLQTADAERVRDFFDRAHGEIERMLGQTSGLLSNLTDCAAVVLGPPYDASLVRSIQLVALTERVVLVVVVLANGVVEKHTVELRAPISEADVAAAQAALSAHAQGRAPSGLGAAPSSGTAAADGLVATAVELMGGDNQVHDAEHVFVDGASRVASSFEAVETVREILGILEQQLVVVTLLRDVMARGLTVAIGTETGMAPLEECALVVSPYEIGGVPAGTIGVLGPTRMDYPQALAAVALVSQRLSDRLTEG
ncbi:MAG TPA: heat-inducible transcriptional repressor HrcA [Acidimicrobiales bacterium]